ncbi:hypothetical protein [Actinospongicola halichondriae]|uniref:hypothetical protein n=1 Tax=Actinospongicola halichondriae TaxID=3236844 RepID=UPI003D569DD5
MRRLVALLLVFGVMAAGCADDGSADAPTTSEVEADGGLTDFVLPAESVGSIAGFEGVVAQELGDVQVLENPDPRGPCGGESPPPPTQGTAGRSFTGDGLSIVQVVAEGPEVDAFVAAQLADIAEPCGPYESQTSAESTQTVDQIQIVVLPDDAGFFTTSRVADGAQVVFAGSALVRVDGVTSLVFALGFEPISLTAMESFARLVDAELRSR